MSSLDRLSKGMRVWSERAEYAFRTVVLRQQLPLVFGLVVTDLCNLDCSYCESKNSGRYHLRYAEAEQMLVSARARGHQVLYFTGGEPFAWADDGRTLADLVRLGQQLGFSSVLANTNGTYPLAAPGCVYFVSIDGPEPVHDRLRGKTFQTIIRNVRAAERMAVYATITLTRSNLPYLEQFVMNIANLRIFRGIGFNLLTHWPEAVAQYGLRAEDRVAALDRLWNLRQRGYPILLSRAAYRAMRSNRWRRPVRQIELGTKERIFTCCRDVDHPEVCRTCGYASCAEISQVLALRPSAVWEALRQLG